MIKWLGVTSEEGRLVTGDERRRSTREGVRPTHERRGRAEWRSSLRLKLVTHPCIRTRCFFLFIKFINGICSFN